MPDASGGFMDNIGPGGKYYRYTLAAVIVLALVFLTLLSLILMPYLNGGKNGDTANKLIGKSSSQGVISSSNVPPAETPIPYILPSGIQTYNFSHGKDVKGPKIRTVAIDPLDPEKGATQTFTIDLESESPVTSATIVVITDHKERNIRLELTKGDSLKGVYQGSWQVDDSFDTKYAARYILVSEKDTYDQTMYLR